ncbi:MAG: histidine kinase [Pseudonocardiales bacterium]|nr:histidine kinase [Pseudonocardiales bacterium]
MTTPNDDRQGTKPELARDLGELARDLQSATDTAAVMQRIVLAAVAEIEGATGAAITLVEHGRVSSPAHSDPAATLVGTIQSETGEGPCVDTARDEITIRSDDLRTETRWPKFASRAVELGVLSVMSVQLFVEGDSMGALDIYSNQANAFDELAETVGLILASHAAVAMASSREIANLHAGMDGRDLIGQAKGILMERFKINQHDAFDLLIVASQHGNRKLREVAYELTTTGDIAAKPARGRHS